MRDSALDFDALFRFSAGCWLRHGGGLTEHFRDPHHLRMQHTVRKATKLGPISQDVRLVVADNQSVDQQLANWALICEQRNGVSFVRFVHLPSEQVLQLGRFRSALAPCNVAGSALVCAAGSSAAAAATWR